MLYLIPLFPFVGFLVNAAVGQRLSKRVSGLLATGAMFVSFGFVVTSVWRLVHLEPVGGVRAISESYYTWLASGPCRFRSRSGSIRWRR